jgi:hypothetical protein
MPSNTKTPSTSKIKRKTTPDGVNKKKRTISISPSKKKRVQKKLDFDNVGSTPTISFAKKKANTRPTQHLLIGIDPGTKNLAWAAVQITANTAEDLECDLNYKTLAFGLYDIKVNDDGSEGEGTWCHYRKMILSRFTGDPAFNSVITQMHRSDIPIRVFIENQEGMSSSEPKALAQGLMPQCYVAGCLASLMSLHYRLDHVSHPSKQTKWGNTSCLALTKGSKTKAISKTLRKNFFIHYVMNLLERQKNTVLLNALESLKMEDRAHICDSITMAMRAGMLNLRDSFATVSKQPPPPPSSRLEEKLEEVIFAKCGSKKPPTRKRQAKNKKKQTRKNNKKIGVERAKKQQSTTRKNRKL